MFLRRSLRCVQSAPHGLKFQRRSRTILQQSPLSRPFHSSRPNYIIPEALELSHSVFQEIHTLTGLPWGISIPLTAALFRIAWIPLQIVANRNIQQVQSQAPLLVGWRKAYQGIARLKFPEGTESSAKNAESWVQTQLLSRQKEIRKHDTYIHPWVRLSLQLSFVPVWILNADVIRRMAGDERTLLSLFFKSEHGKLDTGLVPAEPALQSESFYWIANLASPDELWILPLTFGALSVASAWMVAGKNMKKQQSKITGMLPGRRRSVEVFYLQLSQFVVAASFVIPFILIKSETASAVTLYLIGSVATQLVQRPLINLLLGGTQGIEPLEPRAAKLKGQPERKY